LLGVMFVCCRHSDKEEEKRLASYHNKAALIMDDGKEKLAIYKLYDFTKGGTDIVDQCIGFYTTIKAKSRR